jgi:type IV secretion system protein VirB9
LFATLASGCAHRGSTPLVTPAAQPEPEVAAILQPPAPPRVEIIAVPEPLPLPGQLMPAEQLRPAADASLPTERVATANAAARVEPIRDGFLNAVQLYPYAAGALYQVYTAPGHVTDIALQEGERLVGPGPVAAGDTARWIIGDTLSGSGATTRVHILVKPTQADLRTNLVINTDRRTYHLELRATRATWMASVSWRYPQDELVALRRASAAEAATAPVATGLAIEKLHFGYRISGDAAPWRPLRAFDDGKQVFVEFPAGITQSDLPPLFVIGADRRSAELVNYRVRGRHMVVDQLFATAELRLGEGRNQRRVRITRDVSQSDD